jgi:hypothetical protein
MTAVAGDKSEALSRQFVVGLDSDHKFHPFLSLLRSGPQFAFPSCG